MRVLHFFKTYYPDSFGGVEQVIWQLAEHGRTLGIDAEVLSLSPAGRHSGRVAGHLAHAVPRDLYLASTGFSRQAFAAFSQLAADADIVHYHFPWPFMDLVHFACRHGKPSVLTYHSDIVKQRWLGRLYRPLMQRFLAGMDAVVATSDNYLRSSPVLANLGERVRVIPIGIDDAPPATRMPQAAPYFLFVGALRYYKGLHHLLAAMAGRDYPLMIAGDGPEGSVLRRQAQALGLQNVRFLGAVNEADKMTLIAGCRALLLPSHLRSEAFGVVLLEAARAGKPMVSCEIGTGTSFVNQHLQTGYLVPPAAPAALGQALDTLWHDPDLAGRLGEGARVRYLQHFTASQMAARYATLYRTLR